MSLIRNERTKLLATMLNNMAVAVLVTTVVGPIAGFMYGSQSLAPPQWFVFWGLWLFVGFGLHFLAQAALGRLQE